MTSQLLSPKHAAALLDVHVKTVRRRIRTGELAAIRLGRLVRIPRSEITKFTKADRVAPMEEPGPRARVRRRRRPSKQQLAAETPLGGLQ
ncbi:MAG TPA: helix-turn-helix domain-containing protein [Candidatus Acidoferrales bacterium]|nr:helix-turn-helix domain-containing protein [Candidatus Acidoferrales bacterium]